MVINAESGISVNENLAYELHKRVIRKLKKKKKKRKVYARFKDNIWAADRAEMDHCLLRIKMLNICYML